MAPSHQLELHGLVVEYIVLDRAHGTYTGFFHSKPSWDPHTSSANASGRRYVAAELIGGVPAAWHLATSTEAADRGMAIHLRRCRPRRQSRRRGCLPLLSASCEVLPCSRAGVLHLTGILMTTPLIARSNSAGSLKPCFFGRSGDVNGNFTARR